MTEKEKMLRGELYAADDEELQMLSQKARLLYWEYNQTSPTNKERRDEILYELLGARGEKLEIVPPFYCDYGFNIRLGNNVFMNMNCVILDIAPVVIGNNVMFGPGVQLYGATHPLDPEIRNSGLELGKEITIENDVWIGGGAILCPGIIIGKGAVVAAGAVVTKNVDAYTLVGGNPARVLKEGLNQK